MHKHIFAVAAVGAAALAGSNMAAAASVQDASRLFDTLIACRGIPADAARLACFDGAASALDAAKAKKDIVILDRAEVQKTKRGLFGFNLPRLPFFGGEDHGDGKRGDGKPDGGDHDDGDDIKQIIGKAASTRALGNGKWQIVLDDGAIWHTTEALGGRDPKVGQKVTIDRASLGSYFLNVDGGRTVRAKRVN